MIPNKRAIDKLLFAQKVSKKLDIPINFIYDADDLSSFDDNYNKLGVLPFFLWEKVYKDSELIKFLMKKSFLLVSVEREAEPETIRNDTVHLFYQIKKEKKIKEIFKNITENFFNYILIDRLNNYQKMDIDNLPDVSNIENYTTDEQRLYSLALEGLSKSDIFKIIIIGLPGTGKTYFSKICAKYLLSNKIVNGVLFDSFSNAKKISLFLTNIQSNIKLFYVVDELESELIDRDIHTSVESLESTNMFLRFLENSFLDNFRFMGITNTPNLIDKAFFRPGRIDLLIVCDNSISNKDRIFKILKTTANGTINDETLNFLAKKIEPYCNKKELPVSFFAHIVRLYHLYKDIDKIIDILNSFTKHLKLFTYDIKNISTSSNPVGFIE